MDKIKSMQDQLVEKDAIIHKLQADLGEAELKAVQLIKKYEEAIDKLEKIKALTMEDILRHPGILTEIICDDQPEQTPPERTESFN